jgi:hypothetical protein
MMPKEDIDKAARELEERVKEKAKEDAAAAQQAYRAKLANQRMMDDLDAAARLHDKGFTSDRSGKKITLWEELDQLADNAINSGQEAYNDWRSAMMALLALFAKVVKAMSQSISEATQPMTDKIKQTVREKFVYPLRDKFLDHIRGDPTIDLPTLVHDVNMSDDNKLNVGDIKLDGSTPDREVNRSFETLVNLWLASEGYELAPDDTYVTADAHKTVLTKDAFEALKNDEEHGLDTFLESNVDLQFRPSPR